MNASIDIGAPKHISSDEHGHTYIVSVRIQYGTHDIRGAYEVMTMALSDGHIEALVSMTKGGVSHCLPDFIERPAKQGAYDRCIADHKERNSKDDAHAAS